VAQPTVHIVCSDQHRNGKTLLARLLVDFLLLDGRDPLVIDTDAPEGPLRAFFPGRTTLADFAAITGQMKVFDTIMNSPGRDYVIDLPVRHREAFFAAARDLNFFEECHKTGFRVFVMFIVDSSLASLKIARQVREDRSIDLFVPVRSMLVNSQWPADEGALTLPLLPAPLASAISNKRFSLREFINGDPQGLDDDMAHTLRTFMYEVLTGLNNLEPINTLEALKR